MVSTTDAEASYIRKEREAAAAAAAKASAALRDASGDTAVDIIRPPDQRPLVGRDIEAFRFRHQLDRSTAATALAFTSAIQYNKKGLEQGSLPHELELLIRLYDAHPGPAPWVNPLPSALFEKMYGPLLAQFAETPAAEPARTMVCARFAAIFGRSIYASYRWLEKKMDNPSGPIQRVLAKLTEVENPRAYLEASASKIYALRGHDFNAAFPLPDPANPPEQRKRGPIPGARAARDAKVVAKARAGRAKAGSKAAAKGRNAERVI